VVGAALGTGLAEMITAAAMLYFVTVRSPELNLLQDRIRLSGGEGVTGQNQQRNAVGAGGTACSNHVHGTGPNGGDAWNNSAAVALLCKAHRYVSHGLFVVALVESEVMTALFQCLSDTDYAAVSEDPDDPVHKFFFFPVKLNELVIKEFHDRLSHR